MMGPRRTPLQLVLDNLHREVDLVEQELSLLKEIDQSILSIRTSSEKEFLEQLFAKTARRFTQIHGMERPLLCYVNTGSEFVLLGDAGDTEHPERLQISTRFEISSSGADPDPDDVVVHSAGDDAVFEHFKGKLTILLYPMFSEQRQLVCVFLVADSSEKSTSHLIDSAFANSISSVVAQLAIAFNHYEQVVRLHKLEQIWQTFLRSNISPAMCFKEMARRVPDFLPNFGPIRFQGEGPRVQILIRNEGGSSTKELLIRGTMGDEHEGTRIAVERSVTGLLIERDEAELPFFCDDPRNPKNPAHGGRFKEYLGENIQTELAVRLIDDGGRVIGVLNLESETPNAFNKHHVDEMRKLGRTIGPMLMVFERRLELASTVQLSVASSTARYLEGLASVYRHSIKTPMTSLKSNIELATTALEASVAPDVKRALQLASAGEAAAVVPVLEDVVEALQRTRPRFDRLRASYKQLRGYNADFLRDISSYSEIGPTNLREIVDASLKLVTDSLLAPLGQQIRLEYAADQTDAATRVYCSALLKQHLYSVYHNAVLAIEDRLKTDPRPGTIRVSITKDELPPEQEVALNTSWAVSIKDNGNGVVFEDLKRLRRFEPGTSLWRTGGAGSGLVALERFMSSIGGRVDLESTYGEFFEVVLHIYENRPNI